jgi:hypothetical protein
MQRNPATSARTIRTFPWVNVVYGVIFAVAIVVLSITLSSRLSQSDDILTLTVSNEAGQPIAEAMVAYGGQTYLSGDDGKVHLDPLDEPERITVEHAGYTTVSGEFDTSHSLDQTLTLREAPASQSETTAATPPDETAPEQRASTPIATTASLAESLSATPDESAAEIAGTLRNADGEPIARGWVTDGTAFAFTDADGHFVFEPGTIQPGAALTVFGPGYDQMEVPAPTDGQPMDLQLEVQMIRGLYFNPNISNTQEDINRFIHMANTTEVNAVVIDIKEELVFYDTKVPLFNETGVVTPILDLPNLLQQFHDNDIYTIARLVVFKDSAVAEKHPELAVIDTQTGGLWRDMNGIAWVNPMDHTLWDANIDLAYEAATLGFDEIQYDYIRFPTDGDLSRVSYGLENSQENREAAIEKFLQRSYERLIPTGVRLSADIFGYTVMVQDDLGIGQNLDQLASHVDYLSPMIYPSHWPNGSMALKGHPNDFPYETVEISMSLAMDQLGGQGLKLRPWLQDFNMPGMREYGDAEVRAQIDAVNDLGLSGWLIWDPNNWYHEGAFAPQVEEGPVTLPSTPAIATPAASVKATKSTRRR